MNSIDYKNKLLILIESSNSNQLGIYFSLFLHLMILLFAIGLPDFFKPRPITLPNVIPIEIINVTDTTSIPEKEKIENIEPVKNKIIKQKKFNSSKNFEIKKLELQKKHKILKKEIPDVLIKKEIIVKEKIIPKKIEQLKNENIESLNSYKIKPKLKPKPELQKKFEKNVVSDIEVNPQRKPDPDFNIASVLKDLRNEKSNILQNQKIIEKNDKITSSEEKNKDNNMTLSISEIDLLRQQLTSCWNAPAGAVIDKGMNVKVSAKIRENRRVIDNSVRIIDTNISKSNTFYGPITESAMRTLLNPECMPLKLPENKYNLWKNLTITFDYSIMKGYSE